MRIGLNHVTGGSLEDSLEGVKRAEAAGFDTASMANVFEFDALTVCALAGRETSRIGLRTAVVPTFPRHPHAMAQQAMTAQAACGGRLTLGIGISHQIVIEGMFGLRYERLVRHLREYLEIVHALMHEGACEYEDELYRVNARLDVPGVTPPKVMIGALLPQMVRLAGRLTDGTITWMCGPNYLEQSIAGPIAQVAQEAGRPAPRVVAGVPICVTDDADGAREVINTKWAIYGNLPAYRAVLDAEGAQGAADIAVIGDEAACEAQLRRYRDGGVTDFGASIVAVGDDPAASHRRAFDFLAGLAPEL